MFLGEGDHGTKESEEDEGRHHCGIGSLLFGRLHLRNLQQLDRLSVVIERRRDRQFSRKQDQEEKRRKENDEKEDEENDEKETRDERG